MIFADTFYYLALLNRRDTAHAAAISIARSLNDKLLTTEYVLIETGNTMARPAYRSKFVDFAELSRVDGVTTIVPASEQLTARGMNLYRERLDKAWSFTDCISFVVMHEYGVDRVLTRDVHFTQAGFATLL